MDPQIRRIQPLQSERPSALRRRPEAERSETFRVAPAARDERREEPGRRDGDDDEQRQVAPPTDDEAGSHLDVTA